MKRFKPARIGSIIIALALIFQQGAAALGTAIYDSSTPIGYGAELKENVYNYSGRQNEHYIEYRPNSTVVPVVLYGSKVCNYGNFDTMAALLEKKGLRAVGGTNGDYYVMATYQPLGIVMTDGILRSSDGGFWGIGFREDGTALISRPEISANITFKDRSYRVYGINKAISKDDFYLYTEDYSYTTKNSVPTLNVVLNPPEDYELRLNSEAEFIVDEIFESSGETELREGKYILSVTKDSSEWRTGGVAMLSVGDSVKFTLSAAEEWNDVQYAVGSMYHLIANGELQSGITDKQTAPRTAIGLRDDGSVIMYTVDGRQSGYSAGLSIEDVSQRMLELGCVEACLLDGGGSTNLHAQYVGKDKPEQINKPSGGSERSVTNYIMLAARLDSSGIATVGAVYPTDPIVLKNSSVDFYMLAADEGSVPVKLTSDPTWSLYGGGTVDLGGKYTAREVGTDYLTGKADGVDDTAVIKVIETPGSISLYRGEDETALTSLSVYTGDSLNLRAESKYNSIPVFSENSAYKWEVEGSIGSIDQNGVFTASDDMGEGNIIVTAGECKTTLKVSVGAESSELEGFENYSPLGEGLSIESNKDYVRFGSHSLRVDYDATAGKSTVWYSAVPNEKAKYLSMWLYGNGSGSRLGVNYSDGTSAELGVLEFVGWQRFTAPVPKESSISSLYFENGSGTVYIDQIVTSTSSKADNEAPTISVKESAGELTAQVRDNRDARMKKENIRLYSDGKSIDFSFNEADGTIKATLPWKPEPVKNEEGEMEIPPVNEYHRLTVTARDQSGNMASSSVMTGDSVPETPFTDVSEHWAGDYIAYMSGQGVVNGVEDTLFAPDKSVTRAQCAVMICRWQGIDTSLYGDVALDFVDAASIPDYAIDAVKAVYALGIITGLDEPSGVYFAPNSALTREQAMTVIGRILDCGYQKADLSAYSDSEKIQKWSEKYVSELAGRGVISGFEDGTIRPALPVTRAQLVKILTEVR